MSLGKRQSSILYLSLSLPLRPAWTPKRERSWPSRHKFCPNRQLLCRQVLPGTLQRMPARFFKVLVRNRLAQTKKLGSSDKCVFHGVRGIDLEGEEFKI